MAMAKITAVVAAAEKEEPEREWLSDEAIAIIMSPNFCSERALKERVKRGELTYQGIVDELVPSAIGYYFVPAPSLVVCTIYNSKERIKWDISKAKKAANGMYMIQKSVVDSLLDFLRRELFSGTQ